jgi:hypothetical protein
LKRLKSWKTANLLVVRNTKKAKRNAARAVLCLIYSKKLLN